MSRYVVEVLGLQTIDIDSSQSLAIEIIDSPAPLQVVEVYRWGPPGPPGSAGDSTFVRTAAVATSALRVVYELDGEVFVLDAADAEHIDMVSGITITAADAGVAISIQRTGEIHDQSWAWSLGRIWLGSDGALTQTPPTSGFDLLVGAAISPTNISLNFQEPIQL